MSEQIREQISAFHDGELPVDEQQLLLERLVRDPALRVRWSTYQLIGDGMRNALPAHIDLGLADRVMHAIDTLPEQRTGMTSVVREALRPLAWLAVAASVAVVAVLTVQQVRTPEPAGVQVAANLPAVPTPGTYTQVQDARWQSPDQVPAPQAGNRLNEYLANHSEYAATGGMPGMLPYVRVVGYGQE